MIVETTWEDYASLQKGRAPRQYRLPDTPVASPDILAMLADLAAGVEESFTPASWLIVDGDELVGLSSLKAPPTDGVVEIGYGVAASRRCRGFATAAVADIVAWARACADVDMVTAETLPDNLASHRVLIRNGFRHMGERFDEEDGRVFCWRCETV
jgi:RimJ/RimL family protein N-acetyltransferase